MLLLQTLVGRYADALTLDQYLAIRDPEPSALLHYGPAPSQKVALFVPKGPGPFPVAILFHGGCWQSRYQGFAQMGIIGAALAKQGIAAWNVEYRRIDESGGGYPGMYQDVGAAVDLLHARAEAWHLDMARVVAVGHSAGAQLALWAAARPHLPRTSPLYVTRPLSIRTVVSLGGLADLRNDAAAIRDACGVDPAVLTGAPGPQRQDVLSDTSPAALLPNGTTIVAINGSRDTVAPPRLARAFVALARQAGDPARAVIVPDAAHLDEVALDSPVWPVLDAAIRAALGIDTP